MTNSTTNNNTPNDLGIYKSEMFDTALLPPKARGKSWTLYARGKQIDVRAKHTDEGAHDILRDLTQPHGPLNRSGFACDLAAKSWQSLSEKQMGWVHVLIQEAIAKMDAPSQPTLPPINCKRILALLLFAKRAGEIKRPILRIQDADGIIYRLSLAGDQSQRPESVQICSADKSYDDRKFYGRIYKTAEGRFQVGDVEIRNTAPSGLRDALLLANTDPVKAATLYGLKTGACCFCGRELTHSNSVELGYGPICAEKWGVFHSYGRGDVAIDTPTRKELQEAASMDADAEMKRMEAEGDRAQTLREEQRKADDRNRMEGA